MNKLKKSKIFDRFRKNRIFFQKKAISPLIATILLVVFALVLGAITMSWGEGYVEKIEEKPESTIEALNGAIIISIRSVDSPLKDLQIKHITGQISEDEYLAKEKELISE